MKIINKLEIHLHKHRNEYIRSLYHEILNREPDSKGFSNHLNSLSIGKSKISLISTFLLSKEAMNIYLKSPQKVKRETTIADTLQKIFNFNHERFITALYQELLIRNPDQEGLKHHMYGLKKKNSKFQTFKTIVLSEECQNLLHQSKPSIDPDLIIEKIKQKLDKQVNINSRNNG